MLIRSERLTLRNWRDSDRVGFAALNAMPHIMQDLGGPLNTRESDAKFDRYVTAFEKHGFCRWAIEDFDGQFIGYAGVMPSRPNHPLGPHADIGWRLVLRAWGKGYATEAASASLRDVFERTPVKEVAAYTSADNVRSQAVMARLNMRRAPSLDYSEPLGAGTWHGKTWIVRPEDGPWTYNPEPAGQPFPQ